MIPMYLQIADRIDRDILNGTFPKGLRLKSERDLAQELSVARGTVKKAYAELCRRGHVTLIRGSGSFVAQGFSKLETGISAAVVRMAEALHAQGIGYREMDRLVRDAFWRRLPEQERVRIVWIDCSKEILQIIARQIEQHCGVRVDAYTIQQVVDNPGTIDVERVDLLATTYMHFDELAGMLSPDEPLFDLHREMLSLALTNRTLGALSRIRREWTVAVLYETDLYRLGVERFLDDLHVCPRCVYARVTEPLDAFYGAIPDYDVMILPQPYDRYGPMLRAFREECEAHQVQVIAFEYAVDVGSLLHLTEQVQSYWIEQGISRCGAWNQG